PDGLRGTAVTPCRSVNCRFEPSIALPLSRPFPTRRSSDLWFASISASGRGRLPAWLVRIRSRLDLMAQDCTSRNRILTSHAGSLDRKSTRLNSSHLGISYAVFCLKKKNNHNSVPDLDIAYH